MTKTLLPMTFVISSLFHTAFAQVPDYDHWPTRFACQSDDGVTARVEITDYEPVQGSVIVALPSEPLAFTHFIKSAGHEGGEIFHLFFKFDTPQGEATILIGTQGSKRDGALLSPYGDHALSCQKL